MTGHDWHLFDVELGYEVRRLGDEYQVRRASEPDEVVTLTEAEFEQFRAEGPSPRGLK